MPKPKAPKYIRDRREPPRQSSVGQGKRWWTKRLLQFVLGIPAFVGFVAAIVSFLPKLSVDVSGSLRSQDPMGTVFYLSNDGVIPIRDVNVSCRADDIRTGIGQGVSGIGFMNRDSHADRLSPGHKMTLPCARVNVSGAVTARMTIDVSYKPAWFWWHRNEEFPLQAERAQGGIWIWKNIPR